MSPTVYLDEDTQNKSKFCNRLKTCLEHNCKLKAAAWKSAEYEF